jgi:hypothetical protein
MCGGGLAAAGDDCITAREHRLDSQKSLAAAVVPAGSALHLSSRIKTEAGTKQWRGAAPAVCVTAESADL